MTGKYVNSIVTDESIVMVFSDGMKTVKNTHPEFEKIKKLVMQNKPVEALETFDVSTKLQKHPCGDFYVLDGIVYLDAVEPVPMPNALSNRVIEFAEAGLDYSPLVKFWENIQDNPLPEAVTDLYDFLNHNGIPITKDGCFVAYKKVDADFKDLHTHQFDNSPGTRVEMPRESVNTDRNVTCSSGLHVAAFKYASEFYSSTGKLILVKVNPADVVSVPVDYSQEKMRTCGYDVIEECDAPRQDTLFDAQDEDYVNDDEEVAVDPFDEDGDEDVNPFDDFDADADEDTAEEDDADDDFDEDEELLEPRIVSRDSYGRLCIPNCFVKEMGLKPGDTAYVYVDEDTLYLEADLVAGDEDYVTSYTVDRDSNLRVWKKVVDEAFTVGTTTFRVYFDYVMNGIKVNEK
jgi:hypothetical protein